MKFFFFIFNNLFISILTSIVRRWNNIINASMPSVAYFSCESNGLIFEIWLSCFVLTLIDLQVLGDRLVWWSTNGFSGVLLLMGHAPILLLITRFWSENKNSGKKNYQENNYNNGKHSLTLKIQYYVYSLV